MAEKEADVMRADAEDVYLARELYDTQVHVIAETRTAEEQNGEQKGVLRGRSRRRCVRLSSG